MKKIFTIIMTASLFVALAIPTFAASYEEVNLPELPSDVQSHYDITIFQDNNNDIWLHAVQNYPRGSVDNLGSYIHTDDNKFKYQANIPSVTYPEHYTYRLDDGVWTLTSNGKYTNSLQYSIFGPVKQYIYSTRDISDTSGKVVFPLPPSISQILTEEVPTLVVNPMMETLKILVPFGVGLMVLLLFLPILRKVFYLFQVK